MITRIRSGITLPVTDHREGFAEVLTPCEANVWIALADVRTHAKATGAPSSIEEATVLIDSGHGGQLDGAIGPSGLKEKEANDAIVRRLVPKLAGARVFLTRGDDFTAGLRFRTTLANAIGAHALVSIHNNADPDGPADRPGTETYYQYRSPGSKRLAGLLYEEIFRELGRHQVAWVADRDAGAKYRLNAGGADYYALLRGATVPTVIVESLYISNAPEEELLRSEEVTEAIATAVATGLKRFFGTADPGSGFVVPYPREPGPSGRVPSMCREPIP